MHPRELTTTVYLKVHQSPPTLSQAIRQDESHHQAVERCGSMALGHAGRRRVRHLPESIRQYVFEMQISRRRVSPP